MQKDSISQLKVAVYKEQLATLQVIDELVEIEKTKRYLEVGASSLFSFMTKNLKYSEGAAMRRIHAARVVGEFPQVRDLLGQREVSLCTLSLIAKDLLAGGDSSILEEIKGKSKREVEELLVLKGVKSTATSGKELIRVIKPKAKVLPPPPVLKSGITGNPKASSSVECGTEVEKPQKLPPPAVAEALAPLYRITFTTTKEVYDLLGELKEGFSHRLVGKDDVIAQLFEEGMKKLYQELKRSRVRRGTKELPKSNKRYVPVELRRAVMERDECKCQYRYEDGSRCGSTWQSEIDHIYPVALGGKSEIENLRVVCRNHNQHLATRVFGREFMEEKRVSR